MEPDIVNLKTLVVSWTGQIDVIYLKMFNLVAIELRFFPMSPNSVPPAFISTSNSFSLTTKYT